MKRSLHAIVLSLASLCRSIRLPIERSLNDFFEAARTPRWGNALFASQLRRSGWSNLTLGLFLLLATDLSGQAPSDLCVNSGAANQFPVGASCTPITFNKPAAYVANLTPAGNTCNSGTFDDAFGWFQATSTATTVRYAPATQDGILHVFSGTCAAPVEVACADVGGAGVAETVSFPTTIGASYFFRVQRFNSNALMDGTVCVFNAPPPPANDNPCGATPLTVGTTCTYVTSTTLNALATSGVPAPGCASYNGGDVWFSAVVPASGRIIFDSNTGGITDGGMALYTTAPNTCSGAFTLLECDDDDSANGFMPYIDRSGLTPGTTVWIRFWELNNDANGTFQICAYSPTPPANDNPCGATSLTVGSTCTFSTATTVAATATTGVPTPGCASYAGGDVWFSAVVPASGRIIFDSNTGGITDGGMALYTTAPNNCSGTFTLVECDDDDSGNGAMPYIDRSGLTPGTTVWIRFWEFNNDANGTFQICAYSPTPPANDDPCGATVLPVGTSCTPVSSTTLFASGTTGPPAPTCANYAGGDVWFRLTVPASGSVILETFTGGITDGGMAVYTAPSCTGPFIQEFCDDDAGTGLMPYLSMTGLAPGSTIWVRFWEYGNDNPGTFSICARTPPPPPAGDCVYVLNLFDSFGNGWGSSNVGIRINGGAWTYYTVGGSTNQVLLGMMIGDFIELTYDASGPGQAQNSYSLGILGGGTFFNSGASPAAGPSFGQLVDCVPPPAAPQDCNGGATICNGQAFNNNSSNTGNVVDLNTANQGCLISGERQGTWYYFSPSSSGTIGFTIAPVVATDYDFAVWGPMTSVTCPPPGPPLRCSYAAPLGNTGLGNGATDLSEDGGGDRWVSTINVLAGQIYILYVDNFSSNGQAFNLTWQLSGGASLDCSVLPVELVNLKAEQQQLTVALTWATLSESESDHFVIERSVDGIHFSPLGTLSAAHTSTAPIDYIYHDKAPTQGENLYRVTLIDQDGTALVSNVVHAFYSGLETRVVVIPNPAKDVIHVTVPPTRAEGTMLLLDATGRLIRTTSFKEGTTTVDLSIPDLYLGVYTVLLTDVLGRRLGVASFVKE
jgi:hypothetical protein